MNEQTLFSEALERTDPQERAGFLDRACAGHAALRKRVDRLLAQYQHAGEFLELPALGPGRTLNGLLTDQPRTVIGPYELIEQIGEGGMGTVWMAQQTEPVKRVVALKLIKAGMDSKQIIARFEAERQALALMDHPNIAKVLDADTTDAGRPYFVMDLVKGVPITRYCDEHQLAPRERLQLFIPVCRAIQHAHQKGIIHRDLKPSNVLVALYDGKPAPKVIDFGVAKATSTPLTEETLQTGLGAVIGTVEYMSPEQASFNRLDVDTRSDIYSLGVLLYELLAGSPPFSQPDTVGLLETLRVIREQEPQRPSTKLSTADGLPMLAANRGTEPSDLTAVLRGELDWIALKALEKDRDRRYQTANDFAADIERYLNDEPVRACPPSVGYRLKKFVRRNRGPVAMASVLILAMVAGVAILAISNVRIRREQEQKETALKDSEANLTLAREAVEKMYTKVANEVSVLPSMQAYQRELLQNALGFYEQFAKRDSTQPGIRLETAVAGLRVAMIRNTLGQREQVEQVGRRALSQLQQLTAESPLNARFRSDLAAGYAFFGGLHFQAGRVQQSQADYRRALELLGQLVREHPEQADYRWRTAVYLGGLAATQMDQPGEAASTHLEAVRLYEELVASQPEDLKHHGHLAQGYHRLGVVYEASGRLPEAEKAYRQSIDVFEKVGESLSLGAYRDLLPRAKLNLARLLATFQKNVEAEKLWQDAVGLWERHSLRFPEIPGYRHALLPAYLDLTKFYERLGQKDKVAQFTRAATDLTEKLVGEVPADAERRERSFQFVDLARFLRDRGELKAAERILRQTQKYAGPLTASSDSADHKLLATVHYTLGIVLQRARRPRDAASEYRQALTIYEHLAKEFPTEPELRFNQANMANYLGIVLRGLPGETQRSLELHEKAVLICDQLVADSPDVPRYRGQLARSHYSVGNVQAVAGRWAEAQAAFHKALAVPVEPIHSSQGLGYPAFAPSVHNDLAWLLATCPDEKIRDANQAVVWAKKAVEGEPRPSYWNTLGVANYRAGNFKDSLTALDKSMSLTKGGDGFDWFFVAMAHWRLDNRVEALNWYGKAVDWMEKRQPQNAELRRFRMEAAELLKQ